MESYRTKCPNAACGKALKIPQSKAGKKVKCPSCMRVFQAPQIQPDDAAAEQPNAVDAKPTKTAAMPAPADSADSTAKPRLGRRYVLFALLAGGVVAIAVGVGRAKFLRAGHPAEGKPSSSLALKGNAKLDKSPELAVKGNAKPDKSPELAVKGNAKPDKSPELAAKGNEKRDELPETDILATRPIEIAKESVSSGIPLNIGPGTDLTVGIPNRRPRALSRKLKQDIAEMAFYTLNKFSYRPYTPDGAADAMRKKLEAFFASGSLGACAYQMQMPVGEHRESAVLGRLPNFSQGNMWPYMVKYREQGGETTGVTKFTTITPGRTMQSIVPTSFTVYSRAESGNLLRRDANGNYVFSRAAEQVFDAAVQGPMRDEMDLTSNAGKQSVLTLLETSVRRENPGQAQVTLSGSSDRAGATYTIFANSGATTCLETQHFRLRDSSRLSATRTLANLADAWSEETVKLRKEAHESLNGTYDAAVRDNLSYDLAAVSLLRSVQKHHFSTAALDCGEGGSAGTGRFSTAGDIYAGYVLNRKGEIAGTYCIPDAVGQAAYVEVAICGPEEAVGKEVLLVAAKGWKDACAKLNFADAGARKEAFSSIKSVCQENNLRAIKVTMLDASGAMLGVCRDVP